MMPMTPSGTRTRSMVMPFGRVQRSVTLPTGSTRARTTSMPSAMAATRLSSSASRSRKAAVAPAALAVVRSSALAARISDLRARIACATLSSAWSFCAVGACASTRAAARACCPSADMAVSAEASTVLSGAVMVCPSGPFSYHARARGARWGRGKGEVAFLPRPDQPCNEPDEKVRWGLDKMKLKNQVAIVTGAGRNIGEEVAKLFAAEGAKVAVVDLDRLRGERTVNAIKAQGGEAELFVTDVSKGADVSAMVKAVVGRFGRIDILVNNVAISDNKSLLDITEEDWDRVMTVTLKSQFLMSKHVAQQMIAQGSGGKIVNVGSTSGWQGRPRATAYSAAKAAIANFTRTIAVQLAPHNIRVNAIVPNKIGSPVGRDEFDPTRPVMNMLKRAGRPEEAAQAILFLASDDSSFIIGENLFVDGGTMAMDLSSY